jgi:hypothetical protein
MSSTGKRRELTGYVTEQRRLVFDQRDESGNCPGVTLACLRDQRRRVASRHAVQAGTRRISASP